MAKVRTKNLTTILGGGHQGVDLVCKAWTDVFEMFRMDAMNKLKEADEAASEFQLADVNKMESIPRPDRIGVKDPRAAESLKAWGERYYVKTDSIRDKEYEIDLIIYATGFEILTDWSQRSYVEVCSRDGVTLNDKWIDGAATFHGWTARDCPNYFFIHMAQAAQPRRYTHVSLELFNHVAHVIPECQRRAIKSIEPTEEAEKKWTEEVLDKGRYRFNILAECTPSYLNGEDNMNGKTIRNACYGGGPSTIKLKHDKGLESCQQSGRPGHQV
ncbi:hypothetical protein PV10_06812 [Exophiala mesophila]|uniref:Uncharacterized protein n=1 Tax=Exophiala mesophila TaxID=212818 RepID=A0A0D1XVV2_EXOME|nr:uncharacterized protein PV10_06812 [Exophiala mesophila]KIV92366.1 hypothetical protein PV10_06812 [Exophiala mesophila]